MTHLKKIDRFLVWITSSVFIIALIAVFTMHETSAPLKLDIINQPMLGNYNSPVQMIVFEDLMCEECQYFATEVFPKLNEEFIKTGKISYKLIPISFLPYSKKVTEAAYCIYEQNQELFWEFLDLWFEKVPSFQVNATLQEVIQSLPNLDRLTYNNCLASKTYAITNEHNLKLAEEMIKPEVEVPAVFINGKRAPSCTYNTLKQIILAEIERNEI
ncbi:MAG: thioredoxin domain-containing protein [Rhabdochlamydiaceae bacterium]|nr:thioredoxin domain-containing protein [Candidatus Amphrikana amoebophyrae]